MIVLWNDKDEYIYIFLFFFFQARDILEYYKIIIKKKT